MNLPDFSFDSIESFHSVESFFSSETDESYEGYDFSDSVESYRGFESVGAAADTFADLSLLDTRQLDNGRLHPAQAVGVEFLLRVKRALLADDPGFGKSVQAAGLFAHLKASGQLSSEYGQRALLLVPTAQLVTQLATAIGTFVPSLTIANTAAAAVKPGADLPSTDLLISTYALMNKRLSAFEEAGFSLVIGDEATHLQGTGTVPEAFRELALRARRVVLMTGSPYGRDSLGVRRMLQAAGIATPSEDAWIRALHYFKVKQPGNRLIAKGLRDDAPLILRSWMDPYTLRREGPLPGVAYPKRVGEHRRLVAPTDAQVRALAEAEALWERDSRAGFLASKQATAFVDGVSAKASAIVAEVHGRPADEKIIVFAEWTRTLDILEAGFTAAGIGTIRIDGSTAHIKRVGAVELFRTDPAIRVLLGTNVLCEGLDLQFARTLLSHDGHDTDAHAVQLMGRVRRPRSPHQTFEMISFELDDRLDSRRRDRQDRRAAEAALLTPDNNHLWALSA